MSIYSKIDIEEEEKEIRKQFKLSYEDITYIDFQELEFDFEKKVCLNITIYLKIAGYAPKYALEYLKGMRVEDIKKELSFFSK